MILEKTLVPGELAEIHMVLVRGKVEGVEGHHYLAWIVPCTWPRSVRLINNQLVNTSFPVFGELAKKH